VPGVEFDAVHAGADMLVVFTVLGSAGVKV
jgi:hypothetical protein